MTVAVANPHSYGHGRQWPASRQSRTVLSGTPRARRSAAASRSGPQAAVAYPGRGRASIGMPAGSHVPLPTTNDRVSCEPNEQSVAVFPGRLCRKQLANAPAIAVVVVEHNVLAVLQAHGRGPHRQADVAVQVALGGSSRLPEPSLRRSRPGGPRALERGHGFDDGWHVWTREIAARRQAEGAETYVICPAQRSSLRPLSRLARASLARASGRPTHLPAAVSPCAATATVPVLRRRRRGRTAFAVFFHLYSVHTTRRDTHNRRTTGGQAHLCRFGRPQAARAARLPYDTPRLAVRVRTLSVLCSCRYASSPRRTSSLYSSLRSK